MVNQEEETEQRRLGKRIENVARRPWWRLRWCARWRWWISFSVFAWLAFAMWMLYVAVARTGFELPAFFAIYLLLTVVCSGVAFLLVAIDKRRAIKDQPRISERTLHLLAAAGGWPGAYLARRIFHHKTLKVSFRAVSWVIIAVHALIIAYGFWSGWYWYGVKTLFTG